MNLDNLEIIKSNGDCGIPKGKEFFWSGDPKKIPKGFKIIKGKERERIIKQLLKEAEEDL